MRIGRECPSLGAVHIVGRDRRSIIITHDYEILVAIACKVRQHGPRLVRLANARHPQKLAVGIKLDDAGEQAVTYPLFCTVSAPQEYADPGNKWATVALALNFMMRSQVS